MCLYKLAKITPIYLLLYIYTIILYIFLIVYIYKLNNEEYIDSIPNILNYGHKEYYVVHQMETMSVLRY